MSGCPLLAASAARAQSTGRMERDCTLNNTNTDTHRESERARERKTCTVRQPLVLCACFLLDASRCCFWCGVRVVPCSVVLFFALVLHCSFHKQAPWLFVRIRVRLDVVRTEYCSDSREMRNLLVEQLCANLQTTFLFRKVPYEG